MSTPEEEKTRLQIPKENQVLRHYQTVALIRLWQRKQYLIKTATYAQKLMNVKCDTIY